MDPVVTAVTVVPRSTGRCVETRRYCSFVNRLLWISTQFVASAWEDGYQAQKLMLEKDIGRRQCTSAKQTGCVVALAAVVQLAVLGLVWGEQRGGRQTPRILARTSLA